MELQLNGKLALVSGSTAGIGYAIAHTLAQEGASIVVNGRSQTSVDEAVARIRSETKGTVLGYAGDLSRADAAEEVVRRHPGIGNCTPHCPPQLASVERGMVRPARPKMMVLHRARGV